MPDSTAAKQAKQQLRKQALAWREALPTEDISLSLCAQLAEWPDFQHACQVLFYFPFRREVDLRPLYHQHPQKAWYLPAVLASHEMIFRRVDASITLVDGHYGIPEPPESAQVWSQTLERSILLVPGLLFDTRGYRLGYGKGYYDRFLSSVDVPHTQLSKVGVVAHSLVQLTLPHDAWDVPMDFLATEQGIRPTGKH